MQGHDFEKLRFSKDNLTLYYAGLPNFPRNFARDSLISGMLASDVEMLRNELIFCSLRQGVKRNPKTGEEPGKIFHEYPGVEIKQYSENKGLSTEYNACDTTALYLIAHEFYYKLTGDRQFLEAHKSSMEKAVSYILSHLDADVFLENPSFSGGHKFALRVTYWKDSQIPNRDKGEPAYPVIYSLAHIQNMAGLRSAARILAKPELKRTVEKMKNALDRLYDVEFGLFFIAVDQFGPIRGVTSDSLHAFYYLEPGDVKEDQILRIVEVSKALETPAGYRTMSQETADKMRDKYHANTVWPFEQALIHKGGKKFGLKHLVEISSRVIPYLDTDPEILVIDGTDAINKGGCDPQLWTIAGKIYFAHNKS